MFPSLRLALFRRDPAKILSRASCFPGRRACENQVDCMDRAGQPEDERKNQVDPEVPAEANHQEHGQRGKENSQDDENQGPHGMPPFATRCFEPNYMLFDKHATLTVPTLHALRNGPSTLQRTDKLARPLRRIGTMGSYSFSTRSYVDPLWNAKGF
jgi:hypothetical protein